MLRSPGPLQGLVSDGNSPGGTARKGIRFVGYSDGRSIVKPSDWQRPLSHNGGADFHASLLIASRSLRIALASTSRARLHELSPDRTASERDPLQGVGANQRRIGAVLRVMTCPKLRPKIPTESDDSPYSGARSGDPPGSESVAVHDSRACRVTSRRSQRVR